MTALIQRKPLIRSAYWRLHEIVEALLRSAVDDSDYRLSPAFSTRLSSFIDPETLCGTDAKFVKDHSVGYLLMALPRVAAGRVSDAGRVPIPLLAVQLTDEPGDHRSLMRDVRRIMPRYACLQVTAIERARELINQEFPTLVSDVKAALAKGSTTADRRALESVSSREFLHIQERALFDELLRQAARTGLFVVGQAGLSDILDTHGSGFREWLNHKSRVDQAAKITRWASRHPVDFVLCSPPPVSLPLVLIEYDGTQKRRQDPVLADAKTEQLVELAEWSELQLCRLRVDRSKGWIWSLLHLEDALEPVAYQAKQMVLDPEFQDAVLTSIQSTVQALLGPDSSRTKPGHWLAQDHAALITMLLKRVSHLDKTLVDIRNAPDPYEAIIPEGHPHWDEWNKLQRPFYDYMYATDSLHEWSKHDRRGPPPWRALGLLSESSLDGGIGDTRVIVELKSGPELEKVGVSVRQKGAIPVMMLPYGHRREEVWDRYLMNLRTRLEGLLAETFRPRADELHRLYCENIG